MTPLQALHDFGGTKAVLSILSKSIDLNGNINALLDSFRLLQNHPLFLILIVEYLENVYTIITIELFVIFFQNGCKN